MLGFIWDFLSSWIKKQRSRKRERTDRLDANTTPKPWQRPTDEWQYVSLQFKANHIKSVSAINVCFKRFSLCACACSTKELELCFSAQQHRWPSCIAGSGAGNELCVSHALGEAQRPKGCVSSADLKPWVFPEKSEVREVLTVTQL